MLESLPGFGSGWRPKRVGRALHWAGEDVMRSRGQLMVVGAGAIGAVVLAGMITRKGPFLPLIAIAALGALLAVAARPQFGAYLLIASTPLVAGINRGGAVPAIRPNEGLLMVVAAALVLRFALHVRTQGLRFRSSHIDIAITAMCITSSAVPLLWMGIRGHVIEHDDILYSLMIWKYYLIFAVFRSSVHTIRHVRICLWLSLGSAAIVASLAMMQSFGVGTVAHVLTTYYAPYGNVDAVTGSGRAGATLGLPIAVADLLIFNIAVAAGLITTGSRHRVLLCLMAFFFVIGVFAAGEFSGVLGLAIAVIVIAILTRRFSFLVWSMVPVVTAAVALRPVIERRLQGFQSPSGLPSSWEGRLHNLENYFWPELFSGNSWVLGIRPAARVVSQRLATGYVWIESGYTWLLWAGGLPLLFSFFYFVWAGMREGSRVFRLHRDEAGAAGLAVVTALSVVSVLMIIDPHITYRGSGDLIFAMLGITAAGASMVPNGRSR